MSYDLAVFASSRPDLTAALDDAARDVVDGSGVAIDGPFEAEDEDAPEEVAAVLPACGWTVQISFPADLPKRALKVVERVGRRLAESGDGVLYDPQAGAIVWPRNPQRLRELPRRDNADVARVVLEWLVARRLTAADAHALLAILRRTVPEALPVRFGDFEPMQGRLERDGDAAFAELWDGDSNPFWKGRFPAEYGFVALRRGWGSALTPERRDALTPVLGGRKALETDGVSIHFRTEVADDERWLALLARLFEQVAAALGCFFAAGFCTPDRDGRDVHLQGRYWLGIPPADLWLVWAGAAYRSALPDPAPLRLGPTPVAWSELEDHRIAWPDELVRGGDHLDQERAAARIPDLAPDRG